MNFIFFLNLTRVEKNFTFLNKTTCDWKRDQEKNKDLVREKFKNKLFDSGFHGVKGFER